MTRTRPLPISVFRFVSCLGLFALLAPALSGCEDMFDGSDTTPGEVLTGDPSTSTGPPLSQTATPPPSMPEDTRWSAACREDCLHFETCEPQAFDATYQSVSACQVQCERAVAANEVELSLSCMDAQLERLQCATRLTCFEREIFEAGSPMRPCSTEDFEAIIACAPEGASPAELCSADCAQFALCTPADFSDAYSSENECLAACQAGIADEFETTTLGCFSSSYRRLECTSELSCADYDAAWDGDPDAPCASLLDAFFLQCDIQTLCAQDCLQLETCYPDDYASRYANEELCIGRCANQVSSALTQNPPECITAQITLFACTTGLDCEDADAYFGGADDAPCVPEAAAVEAACPE